MPLILVVEDEPKIAEAIRKTLSLDPSFIGEFVALSALALPAALRLKPDLILLDIRLPDGDGRQVLQGLKRNAATSRVPVVFLTGLGSEGDKVLGLEWGADDYIVKPFGAMELLARLRAVLRRYRPEAASAGDIELGPLSLEPSERRALLGGKDLRLRPREFEILQLLASHPGKTLSRSFLIENSSAYGLPVPTRSLDTHIKNIRKKLGEKASSWIETIPKLGYRLSPPGHRAHG